MLAGAKKSRPAVDGRLPITFQILNLLVPALQHTVSSLYDRVLLQAMFLLAFHAFLRVGEITVSSHSANHALLYQDISFEFVGGKVSGIIISLEHFKHSSAQARMFVKANSASHLCPANALLAFLKLRGAHQGPLFTIAPRCAVSRSFFSQALSSVIQYIGLDPRRYKSHSFRIGAATTAQLLGHTSQEIKSMGRWRSDAFSRYIRIPMLSLL